MNVMYSVEDFFVRIRQDAGIEGYCMEFCW